VTAIIRAVGSPGEVRIAVIQDDVLLDYAIWRPGAPDGVGDVYRGRVVSVVPAMAGVFVSLGTAEGFLPDSSGAKGLTEGDAVNVRVVRATQSGKGPRLSGRVDGAVPDGPPGLVSRGPDPLAELAARYPDAPVLVNEPGLAADLMPVLGARVSVRPGGFDDAIAAAIDTLAEPVVELPGGARLAIYPTPALTAIDVDSGGGMAARGGKTERHVAVNRAVLPALAAQIRLRNLSGAIVVDLAGLPARRRAALGPTLTAALADDPLLPKFLGFTALGLAEIVRARVRPPLHEVLAGPHAAGLAALRAALAEVEAAPWFLPVVRASPAVISALTDDRFALIEFGRRAGPVLTLRADPSLGPLDWKVENHG